MGSFYSPWRHNENLLSWQTEIFHNLLGIFWTALGVILFFASMILATKCLEISILCSVGLKFVSGNVLHNSIILANFTSTTK